MKKFILIIFATLFFATSCHRVEIVNPEWLHSLSEAKLAAEKENKNIFIFFNMDADGYSPRLRENVFNTEEFMQKFSKDYILLDIDMSSLVKKFSGLQMNESKQIIPESEEEYYTLLLGVQKIPAFYVVSKEGFLISNVIFHSEFKNNEEFNAVFEQHFPEMEAFSNIMTEIEKSKGLDKVRTIDALYEITPENSRILLYPLFSEIVSLDMKNETGVLGKYIIASANKRAVDFSLKGQIKEAYEEFLKIADTAIFTIEERQSCLYMAAAMMSSVENPDLKAINETVTKIYEIDPSTKIGQEAKKILEKLKDLTKN